MKALILVVDDDADSRAVAHDALALADFDVVEAENGARALELHKDRPADVVLLDLTMPVLDGWQTVARLKGAAGAPAVVAFTAHALPGDKERVLAAGFDDYLAKPCSPRDVVRKAEAWARKGDGR